MKIKDICAALGADVQVRGNEERDVTRVVVGDLLSFVMGTAREGSAWVTIQAHLNVAAVAVLKDLPLIIISADRKAPPDLVERCERENICVASVKATPYGVCRKMAELGFTD